jgi:hypothetical protein
MSCISRPHCCIHTAFELIQSFKITGSRYPAMFIRYRFRGARQRKSHDVPGRL